MVRERRAAIAVAPRGSVAKAVNPRIELGATDSAYGTGNHDLTRLPILSAYAGASTDAEDPGGRSLPAGVACSRKTDAISGGRFPKCGAQNATTLSRLRTRLAILSAYPYYPH